jgi:hypothetical protein
MKTQRNKNASTRPRDIRRNKTQCQQSVFGISGKETLESSTKIRVRLQTVNQARSTMEKMQIKKVQRY